MGKLRETLEFAAGARARIEQDSGHEGEEGRHDQPGGEHGGRESGDEAGYPQINDDWNAEREVGDERSFDDGREEVSIL